MNNILIVCSGNTCRSPIAQALFLKFLAEDQEKFNLDDWQVISAGLYTRDGLPASKEAIEVMNYENIDLSEHRSLKINQVLISNADIILTMSINHRDLLRCKYPEKADSIFDIKGFSGEAQGDIEDPFGAGIDAYKVTLKQLKDLIPKVINKITNI